MTRRERFLATMTFGTPDRPASGDYFYYPATRERWEREGLPADADLNDYFAMDFDPFRWSVPVNNGIIPPYEEQVLEENTDYRLLRTSAGAVVRMLQNTPPPAMPQWVSYPLETRAAWEDYRRRLDPDAPGRLPDNLDALAVEYAGRDYPLGMWVGGTYGYMRDWWGVENLSYQLYDDPALCDEMIEQLTTLSLSLLNRVLAAGIELDWVMFWEDLAYKTGPLISPRQFERFCLPFYHAMMARIRQAGIPVVMLDSDGNILDILPYWLELGITVMHPMEVAAGMDVVELRRRHGKNIGFFGGIDKRALAGSREDIRAEVLPKLAACFAEGGYIPACDHAIPPDVSFENYCYYRELVRSFSM